MNRLELVDRFTRLIARIWTPPRVASSLIDNDKVRLRTYIRPRQLAYVDAGP